MSFWKKYRAAVAEECAFARRELLKVEMLAVLTLVAVFVLALSAVAVPVAFLIKWAIS